MALNGGKLARIMEKQAMKAFHLWPLYAAYKNQNKHPSESYLLKNMSKKL